MEDFDRDLLTSLLVFKKVKVLSKKKLKAINAIKISMA